MRSLDTKLRLARSEDESVNVKDYEQGRPKFMEVMVAFAAVAVVGGLAWLCLLELLIHPGILKGFAIVGGTTLLIMFGLWIFITARRGRS